MKVNIGYKFEEVYQHESDTIFRFCLVRLPDRHHALDITQETFLRLWQSMSEEKEIKNNRAFLFTVAHRLIIDWYRKKKSLSLEKIMTMFDEEGNKNDIKDDSSLGDIEIQTEGKQLLSKIKELPESSQYPIYLRFVEGLTPKEIAEVLDISPNAVSVRVNRGLVELRKIAGY